MRGGGIPIVYYSYVLSVMGNDPFFLDRRSRSRSSIYSLMRSFSRSRSSIRYPILCRSRSRSSLSNPIPIPIRIGSPNQDRRSMIAILPNTVCCFVNSASSGYTSSGYTPFSYLYTQPISLSTRSGSRHFLIA